MTQTPDPMVSGEARLKAQRARFWRYTFISFGVALVVAALLGISQTGARAGTVPIWALTVLWAACMIGYAWYARSYFRRIDELDLQDNLWAASIAFNFYIVAFPSWFMFHSVGALPEPDGPTIYLSTTLVAFIAYGLRKLGLR